MTDAERHLWLQLSRKNLSGYRFRRQVPMGPYFVDFACLKARLVIEIDGSQHAQAVDRDEQRTDWLKSRGFRVLRFWNNDVLQQTEGVLESIRRALLEPPGPPPYPPPARGREL